MIKQTNYQSPSEMYPGKVNNIRDNS